MKVLGMRCSNSDFTFAIIDGDKKNPEIVVATKRAFPKNFSEGERLHWFHQELTAIFADNKPDVITLKGPEPSVKRSNALDSRLHNEAIVFLVATANGIAPVSKKVSSTIAKDLGLKGKGSYLKTKLDTSPVDNFDSYSDKEQEAILAGWSSM